MFEEEKLLAQKLGWEVVKRSDHYTNPFYLRRSTGKRSLFSDLLYDVIWDCDNNTLWKYEDSRGVVSYLCEDLYNLILMESL